MNSNADYQEEYNSEEGTITYSSSDESLEDAAPLAPDNSGSVSGNFETRFHRLAESDMFSDCKFIVGPQKTVIKGHKVFFSAASEVFQAMFFGLLKETKPVHVKDLNPDGFKSMKTYIYTGKISFKSAFNALFTYMAAQKYLIKNLTIECQKYIEEKLQPTEVLEFRDCCKKMSISVFDKLCSKIIEEKTGAVLESKYFLSANVDTIELILKRPTLHLKSEIDVFILFERWALAEVKRLEISAKDIATSFNGLKKHIRFLTISGDEFVARVEPSLLLTREEKYAIAINKIKFNPKLALENISFLQTPRNLLSESDQQIHLFQIQTDSSQNRMSSGINLLSKIPSGKDSVTIYWTNFNKSICFEADTSFYNAKKIVVIKSKFKVLAVHESDDLIFSKTCDCIVNHVVDYYNSSSAKHHNLILGIIPKSSLKAEHYSRNRSANMISIEGSFTVENFNL